MILRVARSLAAAVLAASECTVVTAADRALLNAEVVLWTPATAVAVNAKGLPLPAALEVAKLSWPRTP